MTADELSKRIAAIRHSEPGLANSIATVLEHLVACVKELEARAPRVGKWLSNNIQWECNCGDAREHGHDTSNTAYDVVCTCCWTLRPPRSDGPIVAYAAQVDAVILERDQLKSVLRAEVTHSARLTTDLNNTRRDCKIFETSADNHAAQVETIKKDLDRTERERDNWLKRARVLEKLMAEFVERIAKNTQVPEIKKNEESDF